MLDRRTLLVGGGAGVGLVVAWTLWPRSYPANLVANPGETIFGAWLKIGSDGHVTVAVPQAEHGQGVYTTLPQVVADELGADWRTVGVEAAPPNPLYANTLALDEMLEGVLARVPADLRVRAAANAGATLTGGSTSMRMWEAPCRRAGAGARALLCQVAARDWGVDWAECAVEAGFVVHGKRRVRFAALAERAASESLPDPLPIGGQGAGKLSGVSVPRIDAPSKVDGSANFAGDVRLADMVHARVRSGPVGASRLLPGDRKAADGIAGVSAVVEGDNWIAAAATTGWAAERALDALAPRFVTNGAVDDAGIAAALDAALRTPGFTMVEEGASAGGRLVAADYRVAAGVPAAIETPSAVASVRDGAAELWLPTQAPGHAARVVAEALGMDLDAVTIHPMLVSGGFGEALEAEVAAQAAVIAAKLRRPVNLVWSRDEATRAGPVRAPAAARMTARLAPNGAILGWRARIAAPATGAALARRLVGGVTTDAALIRQQGDAYAVAGARPPYRIPAVAVHHHPVDLALRTGHARGGSHGSTCFFTECFLDELARAGGNEPVSFRIGMLGGDPRLAQCLSTAASLGGWEGGVAGSGQGVACHRFRGSYVAVMAEAHEDAGRIIVDRLVAAVDCGQMIHPDIVRQQIEGGLIVGLAQALGASTGYARGLPSVRGMGGLRLPRLADTPDITVELIRSDDSPGGVGELGITAVAPAIANALFAATGQRRRTLPLT
ncbi:MAG TPA: molybdopterin cofactor-binding domain-containing protein [Sphingomonas sp.]